MEVTTRSLTHSKINISSQRSEEAMHSHKERVLGRQIVARPCRTLVLTDSQKSSGALETLPGTSWKAEDLENDFLGYSRSAEEKTDQTMNLSTSCRSRFPFCSDIWKYVERKERTEIQGTEVRHAMN